MRSAGSSAAMARSAVEFLKVRMPVKEMKSPSATARRAKSGPPVKQCRTAGKAPCPISSSRMQRGVFVGIARMDDERQPRLARRLDVGAKAALLILPRAAVVVVVEASLADSDHLWVPRTRNQIGNRYVEFFMRIMRMRADRAKDIGEAVGDRQQFVVAAHARGDRDHPPDAGTTRARQPRRRARRQNRENRDGNGCQSTWLSHGYWAALAAGST